MLWREGTKKSLNQCQSLALLYEPLVLPESSSPVYEEPVLGFDDMTTILWNCLTIGLLMICEIFGSEKPGKPREKKLVEREKKELPPKTKFEKTLYTKSRNENMIFGYGKVHQD